eukprot:Nitzschia sp. Nitz4//scaffold62_size106224//20461//25937//NITZ4_004345-RA/size106224-augustus-gene-0.101-mRNA-1//-1//CDS//3329555823//2330//frame0
MSEGEFIESTTVSSTLTDDIRTWFTGLSPEDRVKALDFQDDTFSQGISRLGPVAIGSGDQRVTDGPTRSDIVDWMAEISRQEFVELFQGPGQSEDIPQDIPIQTNSLHDVSNGDRENAVVTTVAASIEAGAESTPESSPAVEIASAQPGAPSLQDRQPDDFRIRTESVSEDNHDDAKEVDDETDMDIVASSSEAQSQGSAITTATTTGGTKTPEVDPTVLEFVKNCCIIQHMQNNGLQISLHPAYLAHLSGDELLLAFGQLMRTGTYLPDPSHCSWSDVVQSLYNDTNTPTIPVYMLLLLRFQMSIIDAFQDAGAKSQEPVDLTTTSADVSSLVEQEDEVAVEDVIETSADTAEESIQVVTSPAAVKETSCEDDVVETPEESQEPEEVVLPVDEPEKESDTIPATVDDVAVNEDVVPELSGSTTLSGSAVAVDEKQASDTEQPIVLPDESEAGDTTAKDMIAEAKDDLIAPLGELSRISSTNNVETKETTVVAEVQSNQHLAVVSTGEPGNEAEPSMSASVDDFADDGLSTTDSISLTAAPGKKATKKKKRKKKRKGSVSSPSLPPRNVVDTQGNVAAVVQVPAKVENSTQTEDSTPPENPAQMPLVPKLRGGDATSGGQLGVKSSVGDTPIPRKESVSAESASPDNEESPTEVALEENVEAPVQVDQVETEIAAPSLVQTETTASMGTGSQQPEASQEDTDEWETVEIRSRTSRKKGERGGSGRFGSQHHGWNNNGTKKKAPRSSEARKRTLKRKMVREILMSVLDTVDEQVRRRRNASSEASSRPAKNPWGSTSAASKGASASNTGKPSKDSGFMKDVLVGKQNTVTAKASGTHAFGGHRHHRGSNKESTGKGRDKVSVADQNTAPTVPDTVSALSTASAVAEVPTKVVTGAGGAARSESSSGGSIEATKRWGNAKQVSKELSPSPPLPTLLGAGTANSTTSSVASSLEAPHAVHHSHSGHPGNENDVGYHLLRVCNRLSRDVEQFMKRREDALRVRRMERGLVLGALQDTLSTIWPDMCTVEMYGSCATNLDLPSSDLDVVVCGLDAAEQALSMQSSFQAEGEFVAPGPDGEAHVSREGQATSTSSQVSKQHSSPLPSPVRSHFPPMYGHMSPNADRVVKLAMELERQPWAVQVKAIPTATVPVIKILADPARLPGAGNVEWLVQYPLDSQNTGAATVAGAPVPGQHFAGKQTQLPWRGADVVNGLLKMDITFEGLEHGGIGSTKFSTAVVNEFAKDTGLDADSTPAVQVLMVLKELLAQKRLNEPFSGGLSSYALLLLLISAEKERSIIRKELEWVERQRKMVAAGGGNAVPSLMAAAGESIPPGPPKEKKGSSSKTSAQGAKASLTASGTSQGKSQVGNVWASGSAPAKSGSGNMKKGTPASSSWATIAKKSSPPASQNLNTTTKPAESKAKPGPPRKISSFADAVAKGTQNVPKQSGARDSSGKSSTVQDKSRGQTSNPAGKKGSRTHVGDAGNGKNTGKSSAKGGHSNEENHGNKDMAPVSYQPSVGGFDEAGSLFPQSFHDVVEVLCSGETTAGKLLMHFLLMYGHHFDSHATAIDYSMTHERDPISNNGYSVVSPFLQRRNTGSYDPVTGMFTMDPIVVYDPLEGAESNNVARSCFAWSSIRWVFAQSYMTLSSAIEMGAGQTPSIEAGMSPTTFSNAPDSAINPNVATGQQEGWASPYIHGETGNVILDPSASLLELLLSF